MFEKEKKKLNQPKSYLFLEDKIRVEYKNGLDSILFEDISSISTLEISKKQPIYILYGFICGIIFNNLYSKFNNEILKTLGSLLFLLGIILTFVLKKKFENVIIESKGGKLLVFSVKPGEGKGIVNEIEEKKDLEITLLNNLYYQIK